MKITDVGAQVWRVRFASSARPAWAPGTTWDSSEATVFRIETDEGLTGIAAGVGSPRFVSEYITPRLVGQDPFAIERHTNVLRDCGGPWLAHPIVWGIELALWDLVGKAAGLPLYRLWGGYTSRLRGYASTIELRPPEQRVETVLQLLEQGYRAVKLRLHHWTLREDIALVEAVRLAVGDRMDIMVDANQAERPGTPRNEDGPIWSYRRALDTCHALEELDVVWIEEPLGRYDTDGLARLGAATRVPLAGGESNVGLHEFRTLIDRDCYSIVQPDAIVSDGLLQLKKVAGYAEMHGKLFVPHHGGNGFAVAAHLHLCAACPNAPYVELLQDPPVVSVTDVQGLISEPFKPDSEGDVRLPEAPGLGVELSDRWEPSSD